ncbi:Farnesyl pyrophosphate synthase [Aphelenchoides fujianensis]|nr:Farnesyl pyrophosphate synthase [Aphelenchoides fujianensis]
MSRRIIQTVFGDVLADIGAQFCRTLRGTEREIESTHLQRLFDHCMGNGKFARSCLALDTFRALRPDADERTLQSAAKVSTSLEFLQSFFLIMDDVTDGSEMRRGKPCWYRMPNVGLTAINHGLQLDLAATEVIRREMHAHPKKYALLDEMHTTKMITVTGQNLDCRTKGLEDCTWERYDQLVQHKTAHYSYTLPIRMGFHLADRTGYEALTRLTYDIGHLFQAQDDYLDCFGDVAVTGKNSTDLADGKCTWFSCAAMEMIRTDDVPAPIADRFTDNFGRTGAANVREALGAMHDLRLLERFRQFEREQVGHLRRAVAQLEPAEIRPVLEEVVRKLEGRKS